MGLQLIQINTNEYEVNVCYINILALLTFMTLLCFVVPLSLPMYEGWNFNSGNYLFTTDTK